ncbi:MarR family winged helix-turn-helix transcriptional regulator [Clostridium estertheticum]|uniref:MarR family winged helix-turn-helix transcriptional regulator n=1 Tax=Clostridium estertheticum TaxID=238834 RepID=UPI001CF10A29|nr:MarR family transcriptional regulator [Clostridium estertheticum]MCB2340223.1 MarR family transcriptional regulator [Clostridium estertheticum]
MNNENYTDLIKNLEVLMTSMNKFKKKVRCDYDIGLFKIHYGIIYLLDKFPVMTMSEFSDRLGLAKPRGTLLIDKLVKEDIVKRELDENDRRVINIAITENGKNILKIIKKQKIDNMKNTLSVLEDNEIEQFKDVTTSLIKFIDKLIIK